MQRLENNYFLDCKIPPFHHDNYRTLSGKGMIISGVTEIWKKERYQFCFFRLLIEIKNKQTKEEQKRLKLLVIPMICCKIL